MGDMGMKKPLLLFTLALPFLLVVWFLTTQMRWKFSAPIAPPASQVATATPPAAAILTRVPDSPLLGDTILREYGSTNQPPQNDLQLMSRLMENALLLLKSAGNRPLSANEDWAALFLGANAAKERFLAESHPALNAQRQLIDRWGTPLFFHSLGSGRIDIRSAGPDSILWTSDDIHRNSDGGFRRADTLNPPSLITTTNFNPR
jgi:hypothetical protein